MGKYRRSAIIKLMRTSLGMTQEQLIEGLNGDICSVITLSRMENGKQKISDATFNILIERMGATVSKTEPLLSTKETELFEKKYRLYISRRRGKYEAAENILKDICDSLDMLYPINRQFYLENKAHIEYKLKRITEEDFVAKLEEAIKCTIPAYDKILLSKWPFTIQEAVIVMNIAIAYYNSHNSEKSINLLYELKNALEQNYIDKKSFASIWLSVTFNLASYLGNNGDINESIKLDLEALEFSKSVDNGAAITSFIYDLMWNKINQAKNEKDETYLNKLKRTYLKKAYHIARAMNDTARIEFLKGKIEAYNSTSSPIGGKSLDGNTSSNA